jgi:hypothetical protein
MRNSSVDVLAESVSISIDGEKCTERLVGMRDGGPPVLLRGLADSGGMLVPPFRGIGSDSTGDASVGNAGDDGDDDDAGGGGMDAPAPIFVCTCASPATFSRVFGLIFFDPSSPPVQKKGF